MGSIPDHFLRVRTEEVGGRSDLGGVDLDGRILLDVGEEDFLLEGEELVEIHGVLVAKLRNDHIFDVGLLETLPVFGEFYDPVGRLVRLEHLPHHQDLLLVQSLVHVLLHLEIGVYLPLLRLRSAHENRWINYKNKKRSPSLTSHLEVLGAAKQ